VKVSITHSNDSAKPYLLRFHSQRVWFTARPFKAGQRLVASRDEQSLPRSWVVLRLQWDLGSRLSQREYCGKVRFGKWWCWSP